jgi:hypothetical protein
MAPVAVFTRFNNVELQTKVGEKLAIRTAWI